MSLAVPAVNLTSVCARYGSTLPHHFISAGVGLFRSGIDEKYLLLVLLVLLLLVVLLVVMVR